MARVWVRMHGKLPGMKKAGHFYKSYFNSWHAQELLSSMKHPAKVVSVHDVRPAGLHEVGRNVFMHKSGM